MVTNYLYMRILPVWREHLKISLTFEEAAYNRSMRHARVAVEWVFLDIKNCFAFLEIEARFEYNW